ncbi:hypothetical protein K3495_g4704 [Podosphaera aphanis]|nr:hypothetical protein K3495_g4704 [Podosphaera aphanis]
MLLGQPSPDLIMQTSAVNIFLLLSFHQGTLMRPIAAFVMAAKGSESDVRY